MQYTINGVAYTFCNAVASNDAIRNSFNILAEKTFGIEFEDWYRQGYWGSDYSPQVLLDGERVVANVSVNWMPILWKSQRKLYIQLGTVMTDPDYRGRGLAGFLLNKTIGEWQDRCDAMYLFANASVLDFYPKYGFVKAEEYQSRMPAHKKAGNARKLDMSCEEDKKLLTEAYGRANPFSSLSVINNTGLLMFYCLKYRKDNVYYIKEFNAVAIVEYNNDAMICYEIFCDNDKKLIDILAVLAREETKEIIFGFPLEKTEGGTAELLQEEDTTLFLLKNKENLFKENKLMFPLLSHA